MEEEPLPEIPPLPAEKPAEEIPFRDRILTDQECADWLKIPLLTLQRKQRAGVIPCVRLGACLIRYNPQMLLDLFTERARKKDARK